MQSYYARPGMLTRSGLTTRCNAWAKSSPAPAVRHDPPALPLLRRHRLERRGDPRRRGRLPRRRVRVVRGHGRGDAQSEPDRKSVVEGKRVSVRVDLGGRRTVKTQKKTKR